MNQVSYCTSMTDKMKPFRERLKLYLQFYWDDQLQNLSDKSKRVIIDKIKEGIVIFNKSCKTCLMTDWSKDGLGFWLPQKHCLCPSDTPTWCPLGWRSTLAGSRFTHSAESRYALIEGEALAVVDALKRVKHFTLGCDNLIIAVGLKPFLKVLGNHRLEYIRDPTY